MCCGERNHVRARERDRRENDVGSIVFPSVAWGPIPFSPLSLLGCCSPARSPQLPFGPFVRSPVRLRRRVARAFSLALSSGRAKHCDLRVGPPAGPDVRCGPVGGPWAPDRPTVWCSLRVGPWGPGPKARDVSYRIETLRIESNRIESYRNVSYRYVSGRIVRDVSGSAPS